MSSVGVMPERVDYRRYSGHVRRPLHDCTMYMKDRPTLRINVIVSISINTLILNKYPHNSKKASVLLVE